MFFVNVIEKNGYIIADSAVEFEPFCGNASISSEVGWLSLA